MDGPKFDKIVISDEAKAMWEQEEGWKTASGIDQKDPDWYFRTMGIDPDSYSVLPPQQQKEIRDAAYKELAKVSHPDRGGNADQMKRINVAMDALSGKNKPSGGK